MIINDAVLKSMNIPSHLIPKILDEEHLDLACLVPFKAKVHFFDGSRSVIAKETMENYVKLLVSSIETGQELNQKQCKKLALRAFEKAESAKKTVNRIKPEPAEKSEPVVASTKPGKIGKLDPKLLARFEKK